MSAVAIIMRGIAVSFNIFVTSKVGSEGMGLLNLTQTVYGFAITLATSGINLAVVRLVSKALPYGNESFFDKTADRRVHKIMKNALCYCLFFSIIASSLLYGGANFLGTYALGDKRTISSLKILAFTLTPISLSSALNGYFNAVRRVYKSVVVQICEQGAKITVVTALLTLAAPKGLEYACIAVVAGGAISEAVCVIISALLYLFDRKIHKKAKYQSLKYKENIDTPLGFLCSKGCFIKFKEKEQIKKSDSIISIALPVAVSTYVRSALLTIEHLAIPWGLKRSGASSIEALGSYGVLHGIAFPLLLFPSAVLGSFASLLIPELSSAQEQKDKERIRRIVSKVFFFSLIFSIGVSGIFVCFSKELGEIICKSTEAGEFIKLLAPLIPLMYLDTAVDSMLKGLGEQLYTMRVNIADAFISVLLVLILLPRMGIHGYVVVIFSMELFNTTLSVIKLLSITKIKTPVFSWIFKPLLSVILATIITRLLFNFDGIYNFFSLFFNARAVCFMEIVICVLCYLLFTMTVSTLSICSKKE